MGGSIQDAFVSVWLLDLQQMRPFSQFSKRSVAVRSSVVATPPCEVVAQPPLPSVRVASDQPWPSRPSTSVSAGVAQEPTSSVPNQPIRTPSTRPITPAFAVVQPQQSRNPSPVPTPVTGPSEARGEPSGKSKVHCSLRRVVLTVTACCHRRSRRFCRW